MVNCQSCGEIREEVVEGLRNGDGVKVVKATVKGILHMTGLYTPAPKLKGKPVNKKK